MLEAFVQFCKAEKRNGKSLIEDPEVRKALAQMAVQVKVCKSFTGHNLWNPNMALKSTPS